MPPLSEAQVVSVMEQELGVPWEDVFETVDPQPLAAGTIAQVHRASLATGEKVVIKIQRPDARELIEQDLALLEVFAEKASKRPSLKLVIDMEAVFQHLSDSLQRELDFRQEAVEHAADRRGARAVPEARRSCGAPRPVHVAAAGDARRGRRPDRLGARRASRDARRPASCSSPSTSRSWSTASSTPTRIPGNLMWQPEEERLYFLDLGMVGEVGAEMREQLMLLLMAFSQEDVGFLTDITLMLANAIERSDLDVDKFQSEIGALMARYRTSSLKDIQLGPILQEMTEISLRYGVPLPASLALTGKALAQMQLATAQLDPDLDPFEVAGKFLMRSLLRGMAARLDPKAIFYQSQKFKVRAMRVVEAIERMIGARPGQKMEINFRAAPLEATVRRAGRHLALGLTAGAAILASGLTAMSARVPGWVPITFGVVAALLTAGLLLDLFREPQPLAQEPSRRRALGPRGDARRRRGGSRPPRSGSGSGTGRSRSSRSPAPPPAPWP